MTMPFDNTQTLKLKAQLKFAFYTELSLNLRVHLLLTNTIKIKFESSTYCIVIYAWVIAHCTDGSKLWQNFELFSMNFLSIQGSEMKSTKIESRKTDWM